MFLYRSGGITPLAQLKHTGAVWFDSACPESLEGKSPRSESVFASASLKQAEAWQHYRLFSKRDADIWRIEIPDEVVVHGHWLSLFEAAESYLYDDNGIASEAAKDVIRNYWEDSIPLHDPEAIIEAENLEFLIPYQFALTAEWTLVSTADDKAEDLGVDYETFKNLDWAEFVSPAVLEVAA